MILLSWMVLYLCILIATRVWLSVTERMLNSKESPRPFDIIQKIHVRAPFRLIRQLLSGIELRKVFCVIAIPTSRISLSAGGNYVWRKVTELRSTRLTSAVLVLSTPRGKPSHWRFAKKHSYVISSVPNWLQMNIHTSRSDCGKLQPWLVGQMNCCRACFLRRLIVDWMEPNSEACQPGNPVETIHQKRTFPQRIMRESHATSRYFNPSISSDSWSWSFTALRRIFDSQTFDTGQWQ